MIKRNFICKYSQKLSLYCVIKMLLFIADFSKMSAILLQILKNKKS